MLKKWMKNKKGYVSIETVIVAGLVIALGAFALTELYSTAKHAVGVSKYNMNKPFNIFHAKPVGGFEEVDLD